MKDLESYFFQKINIKWKSEKVAFFLLIKLLKYIINIINVNTLITTYNNNKLNNDKWSVYA